MKSPSAVTLPVHSLAALVLGALAGPHTSPALNAVPGVRGGCERSPTHAAWPLISSSPAPGSR